VIILSPSRRKRKSVPSSLIKNPFVSVTTYKKQELYKKEKVMKIHLFLYLEKKKT
jgi:hypothetical protein